MGWGGGAIPLLIGFLLVIELGYFPSLAVLDGFDDSVASHADDKHYDEDVGLAGEAEAALINEGADET